MIIGTRPTKRHIYSYTDVDGTMSITDGSNYENMMTPGGERIIVNNINVDDATHLGIDVLDNGHLFFYKLVNGKKVELWTETTTLPNQDYHMWYGAQQMNTMIEMYMLPLGNVLDINTIEINNKKNEEIIDSVGVYENEYYFASESLTWQEHENRAIEWGHLASITSESENTEIMRIIEINNFSLGYVWIGGLATGKNSNSTGIQSARGWLWSDGEPFNYTYWKTNEPNSTSENRMTIAATGWNDSTPGTTIPAIYKRKVLK